VSFRPTAPLGSRVIASFGLVVVLATGFTVAASGCGPDVASVEEGVMLPAPPTDVTVAADGGLFVSSAPTGSVFRIAGGAVQQLPFDGWRPYGLATASNGQPCLAHFTSSDPLTRRSAVSCWSGEAWEREAIGIGSGLNGLLVTSRGLWAVGWRDTDVEQRDGLLSLLVAGRVEAQVAVPEHYVQFAAELPSGDLVVSAWREDASGFTGGSLLRVSAAGSVDVFSEALVRPAGLAVVDEGVWVADHATGELVLLSQVGGVVLRHPGLAGPFGVGLTEEAGLCVAQSQAGSITCFERDDFLGGPR